MAVQKRSVIKAGKPAESNSPSGQANPLKATPFTAHAMAKRRHTPVTVTTLAKKK